MVSKIKAEDEKSSEAPSSLILPSLPEDVIIDILARSSRFDYPKLSLVSKHFRSLVASPDLDARRFLLPCTENCLYIALSHKISFSIYHWYILCRKANGRHCLVRAPSAIPFMYFPESSVAVGSKIYVFGGIDKTSMTTNAFCMDCGSHTVQPLPSIRVPLLCRFACFIDGKIYVIGPCYHDLLKNVMVVFDIETKKWEDAMIKPEMEAALGSDDAYVMNSAPTRSFTCAVMAGKIYTMDCYGRSYVYDPKESKWKTDYMLSDMRWVNACVVDDVVYYHDRVVNTLRAYDPNQKSRGVVEGLKEFLAKVICSEWSYTARYGGNMAFFFRRTNKIWCAEISLERRLGGEIWGKVV